MPPMGAALPAGISASPRRAQVLRDPWWDTAPCHVLYKTSQESCTHPASPAWLRGALCQPCLLCQLQKLPPKDRGGSEGSSWLLPPRKPFGWGWETAGSCQHSPGAAPHRSCHQRHQVTAAWKGESGEAGVGESSRRAGISFPLPCQKPTTAPPQLLPILPLLLQDLQSISIQVVGLDPQDGTWQDPTSPKLPPASLPYRASLHPACLFTATKCALPPAHSKRGANPETRPTASRCVWHPGRRGNHWQIPSASLLHHLKYPPPIIPSAREQLGAGDRNHPLASHTQDLVHQHATVFLFFFFFFPPLLCKCSFLDSLLLFMATEEGAMLVMCSPHSRLYP